MSDETKVTQEYGGSQIQVLEGLEAVLMIYLHCKYDIISVPSYAEGIYHRL